jgi:hypothetical protein
MFIRLNASGSVYLKIFINVLFKEWICPWAQAIFLHAIGRQARRWPKASAAGSSGETANLRENPFQQSAAGSILFAADGFMAI